jgi:hypothetical protein
MEQRITHACGCEQVHYLHGFASQQDRKARWLATTKCRACFVADKQEEQAQAAARDGAAIAHLDLPQLVGSDRQIAWATTIRASRLASLIADPVIVATSAYGACLAITDAKWWIDQRDAASTDFLVTAERHVDTANTRIGTSLPQTLPQAA